MNKSVILFIIAVTTFSLTGCWGTTTETATNTDTETAAAKTEFNPNANMSDSGNVNVNSINNLPENSEQTNQQPLIQFQTNKVGNHIRTGKPGVDSPQMKQAEKNKDFIKGAENSLISGEMNNKGEPVQTRQFQSHPTLDKVEIITNSETDKKILVHLKNGKVLPLAPNKITNPMTASSYDLLKAVGIEVKSPPPSAEDKKEEQRKKEQN